MSFSASSAHSDELVLDVLFTEDTISVGLRDGRRHHRAACLVSTTAGRHRLAAQELENCRRRLRNSLAFTFSRSATEIQYSRCSELPTVCIS